MGEAILETLAEIISQGKDYGRSDDNGGQTVLVEFVSANPHMPITVDNGRCGVIGDVLANILEAVGYKVTREYYVNDVLNSVQMENLGRSLEIRYLQALGHDKQLSEDCYQGDYVVQIARKIVEMEGDKYVHTPANERVDLFTRIAKKEMLAWQQVDLDALGVTFDSWYSEEELFNSGKVKVALDELKGRGFAYDSSGALWLKSTAFGDEIDRPLIRSNGQPTYIASDVAYHKEKFDRGFDKLINVWGFQHSTYVVRTKAAVESLGYDASKLSILIHCDVKMFSGGEQVMMAKRRGEFVAIEQLIQHVGQDAARFFLLSQPIADPLDFDLDLAKAGSSDNPLYALRSACEEAAKILKSSEQQGIKVASVKEVNTQLLTSPADEFLINILGMYPDTIKNAALQMEPNILVKYAVSLAGAFLTFLKDFPISDKDEPVWKARLSLLSCARIVAGNTLAMLGIAMSSS